MRRRVGLFLFCGLVLPLVVSAGASAQSTTVTVNPKTVVAGQQGQVMTISGTGYSQPGSVNLHFNYRDSPPFATDVLVDPQARFSVELPVPTNLTPGVHLIIAAQVTPQGRHRGFGPGRGKLRVVAAAGAAGAPGARGPGDGIPLPLLAGALTLLLAGGAALTVRRLRTPHRPLGSPTGAAR
jgi:hypothetical protein